MASPLVVFLVLLSQVVDESLDRNEEPPSPPSSPMKEEDQEKEEGKVEEGERNRTDGMSVVLHSQTSNLSMRNFRYSY